MEYVQMDQMEMVYVHVILVIQLLIIQMIIVPLVRVVIFSKIQLVSNVLRFVKLVNSIQLIALRIISLILVSSFCTSYFFLSFFSHSYFLSLIFMDFRLDANQDIHCSRIITHVHQIVKMGLIIVHLVVLVYFCYCFYFILF